ncbi:MAG: hypothetical protein U1F76_10375 [Candidatus Competibacteraceae bacterium]
MTIVVSIKCSDGVVIACDSMLTVNGFVQQIGQKIHILSELQLFAFSGDLALAERFRAIATVMANHLPQAQHKLYYATAVGKYLVEDLKSTGLDPLNVNLWTVLCFVKDEAPEVCIFEHGSQPRYLDQDHYTWVIGSGAVAAAPFLKFLIDTLLGNRQPNVAEGKLLATWAVNYSIATMAGGVGMPIDLATIEKEPNGEWQLRELNRSDIDEILQAIRSASDALRRWRDELISEKDAEEVPKPENQ